MPMTKHEIIDSIYDNIGITRKESASTVESVFEIIKGQLESGDDVKISGFGKFSVKSKKERKGRNPQTGENITIRARNVVTFKPSPILKNKLNQEE